MVMTPGLRRDGGGIHNLLIIATLFNSKIRLCYDERWFCYSSSSIAKIDIAKLAILRVLTIRF